MITIHATDSFLKSSDVPLPAPVRSFPDPASNPDSESWIILVEVCSLGSRNLVLSFGSTDAPSRMSRLPIGVIV